MKVPVNSIRAGNVIEYNGKLWVASKVQHISPGKGGAFVAIEAKALREGNKLQERFRSGETIEQAHIEARDCTFLFKDDNGFTFMDKENYEQLTVGADVLDPEQSRWRYRLATILHERGRTNEAVQQLEAAVRSDPDFSEARALLTQLSNR